MLIQQFIKNFKPINRKEILKSLEGQKDILEGLNDNVRLMESLAHLDIASVLTNRWNLSERLIKQTRAGFPNQITLNTIFQSVGGSNIRFLEMFIKDFSTGPNLIAKETITVREANALMVSSNIDMWTTYFGLLMEVVSSLMTSPTENINKLVQKPDLIFLTENLDGFAEMTNTIFGKSEVIIKRYKSLPKLVADQDTLDVLESSKGKDSVNIMVINRASYHTFNPMYWYDTVKLELNLNTIKRSQLQIENTAAKISHYQDLQRKQPDPANEKMIQLLTDRIIVAKQRIDDIRSQYE